MTEPNPVRTKSYLTELEGLRGLAAVWVLIYHIGHLTGVEVFLFNLGYLGVDLFILLSGFLMVHQYEERKQRQPWSNMRTVASFWCRRFFRIAPLYYLLLIISFLGEPFLDKCNVYIVAHSPGHYRTFPDVSASNLIAHLTFAFGAIPKFSYNTALPDWTLGLEMQFYLVFPLLMAVVLWLGYRKMAAVCVLVILSTNLFFPSFTRAFVFPSFLPLKMHLFLLGMVIAAFYHGAISRVLALCALVLLPMMANVEVLPYCSWFTDDCDALLALILFLAICSMRPRLPVKLLQALLNSRPLQRLGDISYSIYLVHLLIAPMLVAFLLHFQTLALLPTLPRYLLFATAILAEVLVVSQVLYRFIERPGIAMGKWLIARISRSSTPAVAPVGP